MDVKPFQKKAAIGMYLQIVSLLWEQGQRERKETVTRDDFKEGKGRSKHGRLDFHQIQSSNEWYIGRATVLQSVLPVCFHYL